MASKKELQEEAREAVDRKEALRQAYGKATQKLRETHREEFNTLYSDAAKELGVEWSPRPSDEEKAAQQFQQLLLEYPQLAERLQQEQGTQEDKEDTPEEAPQAG